MNGDAAGRRKGSGGFAHTPKAVQSVIVAELDAERALMEPNRKLIEIFEAKIKAKLDGIWGA